MRLKNGKLVCSHEIFGFCHETELKQRTIWGFTMISKSIVTFSWGGGKRSEIRCISLSAGSLEPTVLWKIFRQVKKNVAK